ADGMKLIEARSRLMQALPANGSMVALFANEAQVAQAIAPYAKTVAIAALNAPEMTVISGLAEDVQTLVKDFAAQGIRAVSLNVSHAFHSPLMQPMMAQFRAVAESITYAAPQVRLISNLTGEVAT